MSFVVTATQMRAIESTMIHDWGMPSAVLMETAGKAVAEQLCQQKTSKTVVVVCGVGNNGGDGAVCARYALAQGKSVTVLLVADTNTATIDTALYLDLYRKCGGPIIDVKTNNDADAIESHIQQADVIVDALFGTGLNRPVTGIQQQMIFQMNQATAHCIAVDLPSGLCADTGAVFGSCVQADETVTLGFAKPAVVGSPGFTYCGDVVIADIGIPSSVARKHNVTTFVFDKHDVAQRLPVFSPRAHKSMRGHMLVCGGSTGKWGAANMAAMSGFRTGAGIVTLANHRQKQDIDMTPDPVMSFDIDTTTRPSRKIIESCFDNKQALVLGPGMATDSNTAQFVFDVLQMTSLPTVIDADALNHLASNVDIVHDCTSPVVLTPHPKEASRLLGVSVETIEADRIKSVRELASRSGAIVILKGARTVVCDEEGDVTINITGGLALAVAGSGDVLAGMIGGLLAQGLNAIDAARVAVYLHGAAADSMQCDVGIVATDIAAAVPGIIQSIKTCHND